MGNFLQVRSCDLKLISKSVLGIKTRLVVAVELGTKWMPNSDSASNFMSAMTRLDKVVVRGDTVTSQLIQSDGHCGGSEGKAIFPTFKY